MELKLANKDAFKRIQRAGLLGNYFRMWDTVQEVYRARYDFDWLTVRARQSSDSKLFIPAIMSHNIKQSDKYLLRVFARTWKTLWRTHCKMADVYLQEIPAPNTGRIINLEASMGLNGWKAKGEDADLYVKYTLNDPTNLRHSLEQRGQVVRGLRAWHLLRHYLEGDLGQLTDIWDRYPDATIEASRFTRPVGVFHSQTVIWEVREF
ncbi:hypothetical protein [uncultured Paludibaculum sp.]|uniref:hypothetical protein n=1 Tax=uncultured Paludibaculum sp. TaxID=1765020 RepID=UPI002AAA840D|nr:hypothetical protein [uncultured Paludibaculum sp.]